MNSLKSLMRIPIGTYRESKRDAMRAIIMHYLLRIAMMVSEFRFFSSCTRWVGKTLYLLQNKIRKIKAAGLGAVK